MAAGVVSAPLIIASSSQTHASRREIHTNTLVFIQSDTPEALIFYTLDGSRPEVDQSGSAARGQKYSKPIRLPAGRVAVRAVAVTSDGRRSSTVTKMFVVQNQSSNIEENDQISQQLPSKEPWSSAESSGLWPGGDGSAAQTALHPGNSESLKQLRSTQTSRLLQEPDFLWDSEVLADADPLRCTHCLSVRPPDPFSRFCPSCGANVSDRRLPTTGAEERYRMCGCCGSGNPLNVSSCLTCESCLQPQVLCVCVRNSLSEPTTARKLGCSASRWSNRRESRFCSSCSSKPVHAFVACWRCGASGHPASSYCSACGLFLRAPNPPPTPPVDDRLDNPAMSSPDCTWKMAPPTADSSTQTVGLFYPSSAQMQKQKEKLQIRQTTRERQPPLTSISPGKGFWRRQLDHVCAHLRSYTQNNAPFRALLGDPCMGELLTAVVQEDQQQLTLTISFALAGQAKTQRDPTGVDTPEPPAGGSSLRRDALPAGSTPTSKQLQGKDAQLMMELAPGRGQLSIIQQLLDQGADPACCHSNGRHALAVAVLNGHHPVLPVLVQRGADVDQQSGLMKNSALHEAAALGSEGLLAAEVLLSCGANMRRKNASGQTAFQLAAKAGCNEMVSLLAAQTGLALLDKLVKKK